MDNLHACLIAYTKLTLSAGSWSSLNPVNIINNYISVEKTFHAVSVYPPLSWHSVSHASQAIIYCPAGNKNQQE